MSIGARQHRQWQEHLMDQSRRVDSAHLSIFCCCNMRGQAEAPIPELVAFEEEIALAGPWPNSNVPFPKIGESRHGLPGGAPSLSLAFKD
jgi:hypothetical protein